MGKEAASENGASGALGPLIPSSDTGDAEQRQPGKRLSLLLPDFQNLVLFFFLTTHLLGAVTASSSGMSPNMSVNSPQMPMAEAREVQRGSQASGPGAPLARVLLLIIYVRPPG